MCTTMYYVLGDNEHFVVKIKIVPKKDARNENGNKLNVNAQEFNYPVNANTQSTTTPTQSTAQSTDTIDNR